MKSMTRWFLDNPVAANLLMVFILVGGYLSWQSLRVESFPQIAPSQLVITVAYPGGTARQIDQGITQRVEDAVSSVPGIKSIVSTSYPGYASITVKKNTGVALEEVLEDVRNKIESIEGLPEKAERPRVHPDDFSNLASFVLVFGGQDPALLQNAAARVFNELKKHPAISSVDNLGKLKRQIVIEPDPNTLLRYGLSMEMLAERISQWSLEYRSGELETARGRITLQGSDLADNLLELKRIPVIATENASVVLGEITTVRRDFEKSESIVRYQGEQAVALMITTSQKDNLFDISRATNEVLAKVRPSLPADIQLDVMADMSPYIADQLNLLGTNAWQGLLIVLLLLSLFLEVRLALWVALGIPISIAGAVLLMGLPQFNYSINDITLFGMILVLGILVDDAVVVGESIHQARRRIKDPKEAAWKGVESVAVATIFGVLTTIAAFSPMLWIENELAKLLAGFSAVVIFALIFSLVESKFILPTHLSLPRRKERGGTFFRWLEGARQVVTNALDRFTTGVYKPLLQFALERKISSLALFFIYVVFAYGMVHKGHITTVFFPEIPGRYATIAITMDRDAPIQLTRRILEQLEQAIANSSRELRSRYALSAPAIRKHLVALDSARKIEMTAELSAEALSSIPSQEILRVLRARVGSIEGAYSSSFSLTDEPAGGTSITIAAPGRDQAKHIAAGLVEKLSALPGVNDAYDNGQGGKRQLKITLNERGRRLGVDQRSMATLVGGAFGGFELHRVMEGGDETIVKLQFPNAHKRTVEQLKNAPVQVEPGRFVNLGEIAHFEYSREPEALHRRNRNEVVTVHWHQNRDVASPQETWEVLESQTVDALRAMYPRVRIEAAGEFAEIVEVQSGFKKAMLLTLLLIYVLLAVPLKSYWQPLIIMTVIPFGFAGAVLGHGIMGLSVSLLSMFGMMAMAGVVINDSLVLITRFNQLNREGMPTEQALIEAGTSRMRAIFLTTVTTVCGLLPLLAETSEQAQYLKPAAVSLAFGELFATPITLLLIPLLLASGTRKPEQGLVSK